MADGLLRTALRGRARAVLVGSLAGLVCVVSACGSEGGSAGTAGGSATSSSSSSGTVEEADLRAWMVRAEDLPGRWRSSERPTGGFRQQVCGVDIEPTPPTSGDRVRFSQGGLGPFLAQYVRLHDSARVPQRVVGDLQGALQGCDHYTTKGDGSGQSARFRVEPLQVDGLPDHAVAWRQTATRGARITTDMVLVAKGEGLVAFVSYAVREDPNPQVVADAVAALERKDLP